MIVDIISFTNILFLELHFANDFRKEITFSSRPRSFLGRKIFVAGQCRSQSGRWETFLYVTWKGLNKSKRSAKSVNASSRFSSYRIWFVGCVVFTCSANSFIICLTWLEGLLFAIGWFPIIWNNGNRIGHNSFMTLVSFTRI